MTISYRLVENFVKDILRHKAVCKNFELRFTNVTSNPDYKKYGLICSCNTPFVVNFIDREKSGYDAKENFVYKLITESDESRELFLSSIKCDHGLEKDKIMSCKTCLVNGVMRS